MKRYAGNVKHHIRQTIPWFLLFMILFSCGSLLFGGGTTEEVWENPYIDVTQDLWYYTYVTELNELGVIPSADKFLGDTDETRGNFVLYLYNLNNTVFAENEKERTKQQKKSKTTQAETAVFTDVAEDAAYYDAVYWAYENGIITGTGDSTFSPEETITREQVCTILIRFAKLEEVTLEKIAEARQFNDSLYIQSYARSYVTACLVAGIISGYEDGYFYPASNMSKAECAAVIYRLMQAAQAEISGSATVDLTEGAYDSLYNRYTDLTIVEEEAEEAEETQETDAQQTAEEIIEAED